MSPLTSFVNDGHGGVHHNLHHESSITGTRSGQILWIRGLTRLQTQVGRKEDEDLEPNFNAAFLSRFLSHSLCVRFLIIVNVSFVDQIEFLSSLYLTLTLEEALLLPSEAARSNEQICSEILCSCRLVEDLSNVLAQEATDNVIISG